MSSEAMGILELTLIFGSVLGFGVYQLWTVRRSQRRDEEKKGDGPQISADERK